jgi:3-deoxy-manno-octulosonate cytidylyltransferase (CMP-KDO synthetase)
MTRALVSSDCLVVIPSRYGSQRFPGKVLAELGGKPIVRWCWEAAVAAKVGQVVVATEDDRVAAAVRAFGGEAVLTSPNCVSGTDRTYEAARHHKRFTRVINVQGDQPLIKPMTIRKVAELLKKNPKADIATAVMPLEDEERVASPNVVKAVMNKDGRCLYFSRSPIPFPRDGGNVRRWEHLGIYGYQRKALERFVKLKPSRLETTEMLEQLRALEDGMSIFAAAVSDVPVAIDTPEDLARAERLLEQELKK